MFLICTPSAIIVEPKATRPGVRTQAEGGNYVKIVSCQHYFHNFK